MGGACSAYGKGSNVYRVLVGKPDRKRPLGRLRHRWEDNIKVYLQEMNWLEPAQDTDRWRALLNSVINLQVP
jgi:hypothetical protein